MPHQKNVMALPPSQLCCALQEHKKPLGLITFGNISLICAQPTMACVRLLVMSFLWTGLRDQPQISLPDRVMEGERVTVGCTAPGRCSGTAPEITWSSESQFEYYPSSHNTHNPDGSRIYRSTITFTASRDQNNKHLSCIVYFPAVEASSNRGVWLNVEYPPAAPVITPYEAEDPPRTPKINSKDVTTPGRTQTPITSSMEMQEGFDYTLVCTVNSNPLSKLTWKKSENILEGSVSSPNTLQLTLHNVTSSDDGDYYCVATNKHGSNSSFITAHVEYPPRTPKINAEDVTTTDWSGKQENVSDKMIREGETLNMHCSVDSSPLASLTWIKGGETKLEKDDINNLALRLTNVTSKDEGQYWCVAKNKHGLANSSVFISVLEMESPKQPRAAIIGGVVASLLVLAGVCFLAWMMYCRRAKDANIESSDNMEAAGDSTVIYSAINKTPKGPGTENNPCTMDSKEDLYENFRRDIIQYSSIHFSRAKPGSQPIPVPEETLYSEVKVH